MPRKRKLDSSLPDEADGAGGPSAGGIGGFWGGSASNMLQARLRDVQQSMAESILHGVTAIEIDPDQIGDEVGTDRIGDWQKDEAFAALVADMRRRGQRQPIRVRPVDPDWQPEAQPPYAGEGRFVLQSGRRRLAAALELGLPVRAVISTDMGDAKLADLEERFLENTMRQDLSGFEELLSVGLIAQSHTDLSQAEIAQRLGVPPGDVSLGLSCVELHDRIVDAVDVSQTPKRKYRELIPMLRGAGAKPAKAGAGKAKPGKTVTLGQMTITAVQKRGKVQLEIAGQDLTDAQLDEVTLAISRTLQKVART